MATFAQSTVSSRCRTDNGSSMPRNARAIRRTHLPETRCVPLQKGLRRRVFSDRFASPRYSILSTPRSTVSIRTVTTSDGSRNRFVTRSLASATGRRRPSHALPVDSRKSVQGGVCRCVSAASLTAPSRALSQTSLAQSVGVTCCNNPEHDTPRSVMSLPTCVLQLGCPSRSHSTGVTEPHDVLQMCSNCSRSSARMTSSECLKHSETCFKQAHGTPLASKAHPLPTSADNCLATNAIGLAHSFEAPGLALNGHHWESPTLPPARGRATAAIVGNSDNVDTNNDEGEGSPLISVEAETTDAGWSNDTVRPGLGKLDRRISLPYQRRAAVSGSRDWVFPDVRTTTDDHFPAVHASKPHLRSCSNTPLGMRSSTYSFRSTSPRRWTRGGSLPVSSAAMVNNGRKMPCSTRIADKWRSRRVRAGLPKNPAATIEFQRLSKEQSHSNASRKSEPSLLTATPPVHPADSKIVSKAVRRNSALSYPHLDRLVDRNVFGKRFAKPPSTMKDEDISAGFLGNSMPVCNFVDQEATHSTEDKDVGPCSVSLAVHTVDRGTSPMAHRLVARGVVQQVQICHSFPLRESKSLPFGAAEGTSGTADQKRNGCLSMSRTGTSMVAIHSCVDACVENGGLVTMSTEASSIESSDFQLTKATQTSSSGTIEGDFLLNGGIPVCLRDRPLGVSKESAITLVRDACKVRPQCQRTETMSLAATTASSRRSWCWCRTAAIIRLTIDTSTRMFCLLQRVGVKCVSSISSVFASAASRAKKSAKCLCPWLRPTVVAPSPFQPGL